MAIEPSDSLILIFIVFHQVPAEASSLTKDHCFILEVDHDIFVLMPEGAKASQRRKIISVANTLRDDYHNGRATIEIIGNLKLIF